MKTAVTQTSRDAYHALTSTSKQCNAILDAMRAGTLYTRRQVAKLVGLETSTSAARFNALIAAGQVKVCGRIKDPVSGVSVEAVVKVAQQMELIA